VVYDVVDARPLRPHDVLLVEGVNVLQSEAGALRHLDLAVYLDADEWLLIEWFVDRFKRLREQALSDPSGFYHQFAAFSESETDSFARHIWRAINGPNLEAHILPSRENAHVVIAKRERHGVDAVFLRSVG
jgi:type I pantothenate kinase